MEEGHSDCEVVSSSRLSKTGPSSSAALSFLKKAKIKIRPFSLCFSALAALCGEICSRSPVPSASLSELDPLLSEEDPAFLEVAMDSKGFSAVKKKDHVHVLE